MKMPKFAPYSVAFAALLDALRLPRGDADARKSLAKAGGVAVFAGLRVSLAVIALARTRRYRAFRNSVRVRRVVARNARWRGSEMTWQRAPRAVTVAFRLIV